MITNLELIQAHCMGEFYDVKNTAVQMVEELYFALNNT
jgi:hypothetical protein